ncbi:MAG: restriction endonuclease [Hyphomicrobium sp.]
MVPTSPIAPATVRYIKLGAGGVFAPACLERDEIHLSYKELPHELCVAGDWDRVVDWFVQRGRKLGKARDATREIRDFYTLGSDCLWITFSDGYLWWAFAEDEVTWRGTDDPMLGPRSRSTIGAWRNTSIGGRPLRTQSLTSKLTQVGNYRQTICQVGHDAYLLRKINDTSEPIVAEAEAARKMLIDVATRMIGELHWADFEVLADLILARGGWQRVSVLGETMADIDMLIEQPTLGERATVQVKSRANQSVLDEHIRHFQRSGETRTFFICHSPDGKLSMNATAGVHVWAGSELAAVAVKSGLFEWLMDRVG